MPPSRPSRRSARGAALTNGLQFQDIPPETAPTNLPSPPKATPAPGICIPKCSKGERHKAPGDELGENPDDSEEHPEWFYGVVTHVIKTGCSTLFQGDDLGTRCDACLEAWNECRVADDADLNDFDELAFRATEVKAKLRKAPRRPWGAAPPT